MISLVQHLSTGEGGGGGVIAENRRRWASDLPA